MVVVIDSTIHVLRSTINSFKIDFIAQLLKVLIMQYVDQGSLCMFRQRVVDRAAADSGQDGVNPPSDRRIDREAGMILNTSLNISLLESARTDAKHEHNAGYLRQSLLYG